MINEAFRRPAGQPFEYHYLVSLFFTSKKNDTPMIKDMFPGIEKLFGFKLELNYV